MELHSDRIKVGTRVLYVHTETACGGYEYVNDSKIIFLN